MDFGSIFTSPANGSCSCRAMDTSPRRLGADPGPSRHAGCRGLVAAFGKGGPRRLGGTCRKQEWGLHAARDVVAGIRIVFGAVRARRAVAHLAVDPITAQPGTAVRRCAHVVRMGVILAPLHDIADHVVQAECVLPLETHRQRAGPGIVVLLLRPARGVDGAFVVHAAVAHVPGDLVEFGAVARAQDRHLAVVEWRRRAGGRGVLPLGFARQP